MTELLKVLIVEDSKDDALLVGRELQRSGREVQLKRAETAQDLSAALELQEWDVVIADYSLPNFNGLEALNLVRARGLDVPFILVSGSVGEDIAVDAMKRGAHDYIMKSSLARLGPAVERELREAEVRRQRRAAQEALVRSERYFRSLLHGIREDILVIDRSYHIMDVNNAFLVTTGHKREDVIGSACYEIGHGCDGPCQQGSRGCPARQVFETHEAHQCWHQHTREDGSKVWVDVLASPLRDQDGEVTHVIEALRDVTDLKESEEALQESQRALATLMSNLPGMAYRCRNDRDWRMEFVSEGCFELTGYRPEALVDNRAVSYGQLIHPEDRSAVWSAVQDALQQDRPFVIAHRLVTADGRIKWVWEHGRVVPSDEDDAVRLEGFVMDVTERRKAEEALRASGERYRRLFEESNDAIFIHTLDGRILAVNRRACQIVGLSADVLKTMRSDQLQIAEPAATDGDFRETTQSGSMRFESQIKRADDALLDVDVSARLVDPEKGIVQAIVRDITERKRAEEQVERLAKFVAESPNPVLRVFRDGTVEYANSASAQLLRLFGAEVGQRLRGEWRERIGGMLEQGLRQEVEIECEDRTFSLVCSPVAAQDYVNLYGRDITDRLALEEQLRRAAKLEAVGQLAGGVAHDFNNLLTAILGYVDLNLAEVPEQTRLHEDLKRIKAAARRASDLTRQLLAFSRQQAARPEVLDLNATVENVSKMLGHLIEEHVELRLDFCETPLTVRADPAQMEQVLMNLAVNARDAMPVGGLLRIETAPVMLDEAYVRAHAGARAGPHAMLAVTDTGIGMPPEVRERVFEPFFTTKGVGQGTGLGLSTVYGIVQQHGGSIQCYSEPNIGTTFKVYLPLAGVEQAAAEEETVFEAASTGDETVLLAEDEPSVRDLAARVLQDSGYTVLCAADGAEAMSLVRQRAGQIDLILTDVVMPKVNGPAMAREARSQCPDVKLLFMSGYAGNPLERMGQNMVGVPILRKPFTARELTEKVRHVLDES